jgi:hypothetical protein
MYRMGNSHRSADLSERGKIRTLNFIIYGSNNSITNALTTSKLTNTRNGKVFVEQFDLRNGASFGDSCVMVG